MKTFSRYLLESPIDELPAAVEGVHPHQTKDTYEDNKKSQAERLKDNPTPYGGNQTYDRFLSNRVYEDPDSGVRTSIQMVHKTPGSTIKIEMTHPREAVGVANVSVAVNGDFDGVSKIGSRFQMPGDIMKKISVASGHLHHFIGERNPHTIEYDTTDPRRHALYQHMARLYPHITFRNTSGLIPVKRKPKPVAIPESYTQKQMATANKTSRNSGAIGKKAITPAYVKTITSKKHKILDFGSGRDAAHTKALRKSGRNVTAHEFGANVNGNHNPKALKKKYDTVFASNVLNTSSSRKMLSDTLDQMHSAVAPGGALVANLPLSPRKSVKVDAKHLMRQLLNRFGDVRRVGGTKKAPLFHATRPK